MTDGQLFFVLAIIFVAGFFLVMLPILALVNRAIGSTYDQRAAALAPHLRDEGLQLSEDGVRLRASWVAPLAVAIKWSRADVRVTTRAVYLMQHTRMLGMRIGQPILAFPLRGAQLDPRVTVCVSTGWLDSIKTGDAVELSGGLGVQRFTMRLEVRDVEGFAKATA